MIKLKDNDIYVGIANIAMLAMAASYVILYGLSKMALQYAESAQDPQESGIFVFMAFGQIFYVVSLWLVIMLDLYYVVDKIEQWKEDQSRGWL